MLKLIKGSKLPQVQFRQLPAHHLVYVVPNFLSVSYLQHSVNRALGGKQPELSFNFVMGHLLSLVVIKRDILESINPLPCCLRLQGFVSKN